MRRLVELGGGMAAVIISAVRGERDPVGMTQAGGASGFELLRMQHNSDLQAIGLTIVPGRSFSMHGETGSAEIREATIAIENPTTWTKSLEVVEPRDLGGLEQTFQVLSSLPSLDISDLPNDVVHLFMALPGMIAEGKRLGVDVTRLEQIHAAQSGGYLIQKQAIDRQQLFSKPEEEAFGPAQWQIDITPKRLSQQWGEAMLLLTQLKTNSSEGAQSFYQQLRQHLEVCLDASEQGARLMTEEADTASYAQPLLPVLQSIRERFEGM